MPLNDSAGYRYDLFVAGVPSKLNELLETVRLVFPML
jgi:hypothetical protein